MDKPISVGDIARIIKSESYPESVGWIVRVVGVFYDLMEIEHPPLGDSQLTTTNIPPRWLRRIPPLDEIEGIKTQEPTREGEYA